jgi:hypothetical protein
VPDITKGAWHIYRPRQISERQIQREIEREIERQAGDRR